jgi:hypothetical protein
MSIKNLNLLKLNRNKKHNKLSDQLKLTTIFFSSCLNILLGCITRNERISPCQGLGSSVINAKGDVALMLATVMAASKEDHSGTQQITLTSVESPD